MTIEQAKELHAGDRITIAGQVRTNGEPKIYRITSVKTWKRSPNRVRIRAQYGLYTRIELHSIQLNSVSKV